MQQSIVTPWQTTYALTTDRRMSEGRQPIQNRHKTMAQARAHAQQAANAIGSAVWIVAHDEGLPDHWTSIKPSN